MTVVRFPVERTGKTGSERLAAFEQGLPRFGEPLPDLGTSEDWAWSAILHLKGRLQGMPAGRVEVSSTALSIALVFLEELAALGGIIPPMGRTKA